MNLDLYTRLCRSQTIGGPNSLRSCRLLPAPLDKPDAVAVAAVAADVVAVDANRPSLKPSLQPR